MDELKRTGFALLLSVTISSHHRTWSIFVKEIIFSNICFESQDDEYLEAKTCIRNILRSK
jgi:hypothetical protein